MYMETDFTPGFDPKVLQDRLFDGLDNVKTDYDIRNAELKVKTIKAFGELEKIKLGYDNLSLQEQQLELEREKFEAQKVKDQYYMITDLACKSDKQLKRIAQLKLGIFPKLDESVVKMMKATQKLLELD